MQDIQMNSIIIAPASLHPLIQYELLMKKQGYLGVSLQTLEGYLLNQIPHPEQYDDVVFQYRKIMLEKKELFQIYQNICTQEHFLQQCKKVIEELKFYNIPLHTLPNTTQEEQELFQIIAFLYPIAVSSQYLYEALHSLPIQKKQVYIYPAFLTHKQKQIQDILINNGAILLEQPFIKPDISFYHAINMREEIEGLAQYIIQHQIKAEECAITIGNSQYKTLIEQIFQRYQIPFTMLTNTTTNVPATMFCVLLNYYLDPSQRNLKKLFDYALFPTINTTDLKQYITLFQKDLQSPFPPIENVDSTIVSAYEIGKLQSLQQQAAIAREELLLILQPLLEKPWEEAVISMFEIIKQAIDIKKERKNYLQLQTYLQNVFPYLHTKEDLPFLITCVEKITASHTNKELQGVMIDTLTTLLPNRPYHFIVGATQANFPAFSLKKGIFDEAYLANTAYPSMQERYDLHLQQINQHFYQANHLWISYPLGNYEGKGKEAALEIETFVQKKAIALPIQYVFKTYTLDTSMTSQQARALYLKNNILNGSISSLEMYVKCPYAYFLKYGLSIKEPFHPTFDESKAGTLSHHILEVLTKYYGKQYVDTQVSKIESLLQSEFESLLTIYPHQKHWATLFQQRLLQNITQNLKVLKDMEAHSEMSIFQTEYEFYRNYELEDATLRLHGFIDRVDQKNEFIRILDYKSSPKSLMEHDVFAALQLQLCTYGIVTQEQFQKKLLGVYYVSLKNENIPYSAGKIKRRPVEYIPFQKADYEDSIYTSHRLQGWNMDEHIEVMDDTGSHIIGVSMNKNGDVTARKQFDLNVVKEHFQTIYQTIGKRILSGDIALTPSELACTYCPYHEICRYKGFPHKKDPIVEVDDRIYKE